MTQTESNPRQIIRRRFLIAALGGLLLLFLWRRNYNLLGDPFDYSIVTSAVGYLQKGLKPYRDFSGPLQSLTIYTCYFAELVFGPRYLSLAYGNLVLGLAFYLVLLRLLKDFLPAILGIVTAVAICACTYFQHGIIWYNNLAISLLMLIVLCGAIIYRRQRIDQPMLAALCLLLFLSSMGKLNFHALALALVFSLLLLFFLNAPAVGPKKFFGTLSAVLFSGVILGPIVEILINRTTVHDYVENVFRVPSGRVTQIFYLLDPYLLLGKFADYYPDNWCGGIYLKALLIYCGCLYFAARPPADPVAAGRQTGPARSLQYLCPFVLAAFFTASLLLTITNFETQMLTSSFLMVGLVAAFIMFGPAMSQPQNFGFKFGIFLLSGYFFVAGSTSAFMHSRLRFGEPDWTGTLLHTLVNEKRFSALKRSVPFYDAAFISPGFDVGYFHGVRFTARSGLPLKKIDAFMRQNDLARQPQKIYWGPGLEIMNRVYGVAPDERFPLWYDLNVSVRDKDAPQIIAAFKKSDYEWIVSSPWIREMPLEVRSYLTNNYQEVDEDDVVILHQKH